MNRLTWIRGIVATGGIMYVLTALPMLFAPQWFYDNIGNFPPFNRHFIGDLGTFTLPYGIMLLLALRTPARHHLVIGSAALASLFHVLDHLYEHGATGQGAWWQTISLLVYAVALLWAWWAAWQMRKTQAA
ncbi:MAG: hypothetical protein U0694_02495 [Anaerolineae bacterium]